MKKQFFALGTAALMSAAFPIIAADAEVEVKGDVDVNRPKAEARTEIKTKGDAEKPVRVDRQMVKRTEKASGLIGMEVRNREGEKLGEITEILLRGHCGQCTQL